MLNGRFRQISLPFHHLHSSSFAWPPGVGGEREREDGSRQKTRSVARIASSQCRSRNVPSCIVRHQLPYICSTTVLVKYSNKTGPTLRVSTMTTSFPFRYTPLKVLFTLFSLATLLVKLPVWAVFFLSPSARHKPTWSFKRALVVSIIQHLLQALDM